MATRSKKSQRTFVFAIAAGAVIGLLVGKATDNLTFWLPLGIAVGVVYALVFGRRR